MKLLTDEIASCNRKTDSVKSKVNLLEVKVDNFVDNDNRRCNLVLNSIPFKEGENILKIFETVSSLIGYESSPEANIHRFNGNNTSNRPILIKFPTEFHKEDMQNYIKYNNKMLFKAIPGFSKKDPKTRIFIQDDLSPTQYKINKAANKFRKSGQVKATRIIHGNVGVNIGNDENYLFYLNAAALEDEVANRNNPI